MAIKSDKWIRRMAAQHGMIEPFEAGQVREANGHKIVSYGTSSYGYDIRCSTAIFRIQWSGFSPMLFLLEQIVPGAEPGRPARLASCRSRGFHGAGGVPQHAEAFDLHIHHIPVGQLPRAGGGAGQNDIARPQGHDR